MSTDRNRRKLRQERIARAVPTREWMKEERARILTKSASVQVRDEEGPEDLGAAESGVSLSLRFFSA